jgi:hypothetical protein
MPPCGRLSAAQKKEILDAAEAEINKRQPIDAPRMATILGHAIAALVERYNTERQAAENRQEVIDNALRSLSAFATDQEKARAAIARSPAKPSYSCPRGKRFAPSIRPSRNDERKHAY